MASPSSSKTHPSAKRSRRSTLDILYSFPSYNHDTEPSMPIPGATEDDYTTEKLKSGFIWANWGISSRQVSPLSECVLSQYKATCKALLDEEYGQYTRRELISNVRTYEREISSNCYFQPHRKDLDHTLVVKMSSIREWKIIGRYGDYVAKACSNLQKQSRINTTEYREQLCGEKRFWTHVSDDIRKEWPDYVAFLDQEDVPRVKSKTIQAVLNACQYLQFNERDMIKIIHQYAYRNNMVHSHIWEYFDRGKFTNAAVCLYQDLQDVNNIYGSDRAADGALMKRIIESEMKELFHIAGPDIETEEPQTWKPQQNALDARSARRDKAKADSNAYAKAVKDHNDRVSVAAAERVKREAEMEAAMTQITHSGWWEFHQHDLEASSSGFNMRLPDGIDETRQKDFLALARSLKNTKERAIGYNLRYGLEDTLKYLTLED